MTSHRDKAALAREEEDREKADRLVAEAVDCLERAYTLYADLGAGERRDAVENALRCL
jgi:hypothetical protein